MFSKAYVVVGAMVLLTACSDHPASASGGALVTPQPASVAAEVSIVNWGPNSTKAGQAFAQQANGNSAFWFEQKGIFSPDGVEVWLGENKLENLIIKPNSLGTVEVRQELLKTPGKFQLYLVVKADGRKIPVGDFEILAN